jgi:hypothetical protein
MIDAMFDDCMPGARRSGRHGPERVTFHRHRSAFYLLTPLGLNVSRRKIYRFDEYFGRTRPRD